MADKGKLPPFSDDERLYLLEQIKNYKIIESKKTDVGSLAAKKRAWEEIARNFNSTGNFQKRSLDQLRKYWNNMKVRRKKELGEETRELMGTGGGPYKPHSPSCPEVEVVAPHISYHLGYQWDGDAVAMEDATAKCHKISMSEVTAAFKSAGSTLAGRSLLESIDGADIPKSSASKPLSFLTPDPQVSGSLSNTSPCIQSLAPPPPPPSSPSPPPPPPPTPRLFRQDVLQKTVRAHEERAKITIQGDKELHCERLAEAKLNHQEAKNRQQRAEERHRLDIRQTEELHRLEMERLRLKMEFNAEMHRETLQAAKEKRERENRHSEEIHRALLRKLQGPSEHTE